MTVRGQDDGYAISEARLGEDELHIVLFRELTWDLDARYKTTGGASKCSSIGYPVSAQ